MGIVLLGQDLVKVLRSGGASVISLCSSTKEISTELRGWSIRKGYAT
jgi:hypothetical protein